MVVGSAPRVEVLSANVVPLNCLSEEFLRDRGDISCQMSAFGVTEGILQPQNNVGETGRICQGTAPVGEINIGLLQTEN